MKKKGKRLSIKINIRPGKNKFYVLFTTFENTEVAGSNIFKHLTPNDPYRGRTATLTSKRCILYIYSTNTGTEYFKHGIYSPLFF